MFIPKPVWAIGFALEQTLRDATLAVFSFLILKRLQHNYANFKVTLVYLPLPKILRTTCYYTRNFLSKNIGQFLLNLIYAEAGIKIVFIIPDQFPNTF
ncbi:MAG: hypothetical protein LBH59_06825 [Planctomycetaceae bacterium]|nr:hypothetical protein [Planctomycetaceae bacterium]